MVRVLHTLKTLTDHLSFILFCQQSHTSKIFSGLGVIGSQGMKLFWLRYGAWSKIFNCSIFLRKNSEKKFPFFVGIKSSWNDSIGSRSQFESFCSFKSFSKQSFCSWLILLKKISVKFGVWLQCRIFNLIKVKTCKSKNFCQQDL